MISDNLKRAIDNLALVDIRLVHISGEADENFSDDLAVSDWQLETINPRLVSIAVLSPESGETGHRRIRFRLNSGARLVAVSREFSEESSAEQDASGVLARVETGFSALYEERPGADLGEDELKRFGEHNVPFNVWPYWREIVHASFSRMGLPRVILPLYRMKKDQVSTPS